MRRLTAGNTTPSSREAGPLWNRDRQTSIAGVDTVRPVSEDLPVSGAGGTVEAYDKLPAKLTAYHAGHSGELSLKDVGKGEGYNILGPGVYFATSKDIAQLYTKYSQTPVMTEAIIDTAGLYDPKFGTPVELRAKIQKLAAGLPRTNESLKYGSGSLGDIFKAHGPEKGRKLLSEIGITGAYEHLPDGSIEIAVYDLSILSDVKSEPVSIAALLERTADFLDAAAAVTVSIEQHIARARKKFKEIGLMAGNCGMFAFALQELHPELSVGFLTDREIDSDDLCNDVDIYHVIVGEPGSEKYYDGHGMVGPDFLERFCAEEYGDSNPGVHWFDYTERKMAMDVIRCNTNWSIDYPYFLEVMNPGGKVKVGTAAAKDPPTFTLPVGFQLWHGTDAVNDFDMPDGPAWFTESFDLASHWSGRGKGGKRKVQQYVVKKPVKLLAFKKYQNVFDWLNGNKDPLDPTYIDYTYDAADAVCSATHNGWVLHKAYRGSEPGSMSGPPASDIMICNPEEFLEKAGTAGPAEGTEAAITADTYDNLLNTRIDPNARPDMSVPPYDRRKEQTGHFAVVWLEHGEVIFSSRCRDFGHALRMSRQHKRVPTWIIQGLEKNLDVAEMCLHYQGNDWLDAKHMDAAVRRLIQVVATQNLPEPSTFIQPKLVREVRHAKKLKEA